MNVFQKLMKNYFRLHFRIFGKYSYLGIEQIIRKASLVGDHTFYESKDFPWVAELENNWQLIREELDEVLKDRDSIPNFLQISPDQKKIDAEAGQWKTFFFYGYGYRLDDNLRRCPNTARLLKQIPDLQTAFFSILAPGKHIPPHRGPYAGVLRYHLGLRVPQPNDKIRIRVGNDYRNWAEGKSLIFDDTYEHEVWNESDGVRVVLFVDFVRPLKGFPKRLNNRLIRMITNSPLVQDAVNNMEKFTEKKPTASKEEAAA